MSLQRQRKASKFISKLEKSSGTNLTKLCEHIYHGHNTHSGLDPRVSTSKSISSERKLLLQKK